MILTIHDPIYVQDVVVAIAEPRTSSIIRAVVKAGYSVPEWDDSLELKDGSRGRTVLDPDSGAVVIRLKRLRRGNTGDLSLLVHECVHAATMLFGRIGFPIRPKMDEPLAYQVAFYVRSVLEAVGKRR